MFAMTTAYLIEEDTKFFKPLNLICCKSLFKITFICLYLNIATASELPIDSSTLCKQI